MKTAMGKIALTALLLVAAMPATAGVQYFVNIDTSSLSGTDGAIYLQFGGGLNPDLASIQIATFAVGAPGTLLSVPAPIANGGVSGSLSSLPLIMDNSGGLNDYLHFLTYGPNLFFTVDFLLPNVLVGQSGSQLSFGLTASDGLTPVLTQDPAGYIGLISYDTTKTFSVDTLGNDAIESITTAAPEPATALTIAGALAALFAIRRRRLS
jgi:hypothetical protein